MEKLEKLSGTQSLKKKKKRKKERKKKKNSEKEATQSAIKNKITLIIKKTKVEEDLKQNPKKN